MCFSLFGKILKINGKQAKVKTKNGQVTINLKLCPSVKRGDYVLIQNNFAIRKISKKEVSEIRNLINV